MPVYEMPNPREWLESATEHIVDSLAEARQDDGTDPFTAFTNVLRRANPLLPPIITGPLVDLSSRLHEYWVAIPPTKVEHWGLKSQLLDAFCTRLKGLSIFNPELSISPNRAALLGFEFYRRPPSQAAHESPFPHARRGERLEAIEDLWFVTILLSTSEDKPVIGPMPEGALRFVPYYDIPMYLTAPKRTNAASLALAARHFRMDQRPEENLRAFSFESTVEGWTWGPDREVIREGPQGGSESNQEQIEPWVNDEDGYRRIAGVVGKSCSIHAGVSYLILKLMRVLDEHNAVGAIPIILGLKSN